MSDHRWLHPPHLQLAALLEFVAVVAPLEDVAHTDCTASTPAQTANKNSNNIELMISNLHVEQIHTL